MLKNWEIGKYYLIHGWPVPCVTIHQSSGPNKDQYPRFDHLGYNSWREVGDTPLTDTDLRDHAQQVASVNSVDRAKLYISSLANDEHLASICQEELEEAIKQREKDQ